MNKLIGLLLGLFVTTLHAQSTSITETVGTLPGELSVHQGIASYQIPIELPEGRGGNTPQLAIQYSSQGATNSAFGVGFNISGLSAIYRCGSNLFTDNQLRPVENSSRDNFCMDGNRLIVADGIRGEDGSVYFLQQDDFTRVSLTGNALESDSYFISQSKSGERMTYRYHERSHSWLLSEVTNTTRTNPIKYSYTTHGEIARIDYDIYSLVFVYEAMANDQFKLSRLSESGEIYESGDRLSRIELKTSGQLANYYQFTYQQTTVEQSSSIDAHTVRSVQYCDQDNLCLPKTQFNWRSVPKPRQQTTYFNRQVVNSNIGNWGNNSIPSSWKNKPRSWWINLDGDGELDLCKTATGGLSCNFSVAGKNKAVAYPLTKWGDSDSHWWLDLNGNNKSEFCRDDNDQLVCTEFSPDGQQTSHSYPLPKLGLKDYRWWIDTNGDGYPEFCRRIDDDLVCSQLKENDSVYAWQETVHLNHLVWDANSETDWVDLDGNGSLDLCQVSSNLVKCTLFNATEVKGKQVRTFSLTDAGTKDKRWWIDINGDGATDLCRATKNEAGQEKNLTCSYGSHGDVSSLSNDLVLVGGPDWNGDWGDADKRWWQDLNQDGVIDFCRGSGSQIFCTNINKENYQFKVDSWGSSQRWWADLNQDGQLDFCTDQAGQLICKTAENLINRSLLLSKVTNGLGHTSQVWFGSYGEHTDRSAITPVTLPKQNLSFDHPVAYRLDSDNGSGTTSYLFQYGPYSYDTRGEGSGGFQWVKQREFVNGDNYRNRYIEFYTEFPYSQNQKRQQEFLGDESTLDENCSSCNEVNFWNFRHLTLLNESEAIYNHKSVARQGLERPKSQAQIRQETQVLAQRYELISYQDKTYAKKPDSAVLISGPVIITIIKPSHQYYLVENLEPVSELEQGSQAILSPVDDDLKQKLAAQPKTLTTYIIEHDQYQQLVNNKPVVTNHDSYQVYGRQQADKSYDLDRNLLMTTTVSHEQIDDYGNVGKTTTLTQGLNPVTGLTEAYSKTVENQFSNHSSSWLLGRLTYSKTTQVHADGSRISKVAEFTYDPATGKVIKEVSDPGNALAVTKKYRYNSEGFVESETTSAQQNGVLVSKESEHSLTYSQNLTTAINTNPLGHQSRTVKDRLLGVMTNWDPNGLESRTYLDGLGRQTESWKQAETGFIKTQYLYLPASDNRCGIKPSNAVYCVVSDTPGLATQVAFYDMLQRKVRTAHRALNGQWVLVDNQYTALGQIRSVTRPYYAGDVPQYTYTLYDRLGRIHTVSQPGPAGKEQSWVSYQYRPFVTVKIDAKGRKESTYLNVMGWEIQKLEPEGGSFTKQYYADGMLKSVTSSVGNTIESRYNVQGKEVYHSDPDLGLWTYVYDGFGLLQSQTDAKGQRTTMKYDALGRMTESNEETIQDTAQGQQKQIRTTTWHYDSVATATGIRKWNGALLQSEVKGELIKNFYVDAVGRASKEELITEDQTLSRRFEYNNLGQLVAEHRPNQFTLNYQRDDQTGINTEIWGDISQAQLNFSDQEYDQVIQPLINQALARASDYLRKAKELRRQQYFYQDREKEYLELKDHVISADGVAENELFAQQMYSELHGRALEAFYDEYGEQYFKVPNRTVLIPAPVTITVVQKPKFHLKLDGNLLRKVSLEEWASVESGLTAANQIAYYGHYADNNSAGLVSFTLDRDDPLYDQRIREMFGRLTVLADDIHRLEYVEDHTHRKATSYLQAANQLVQLVKQVKLVSQRYRTLGEESGTESLLLQELKDASPTKGKLSYWKLSDLDAEGRIAAEVYGNGLSNQYDYQEDSGQLLNITTLQGNQLIRSLHYTYDRMDNVTSRYDAINDIREEYYYDQLDRLKTNRLTGTNNKHLDNPLFNKDYTVRYDSEGNITYKSDVGRYIYADPDHAHAVTRAGDNTYMYDANGNMVTGGGRVIDWNAFNKPERIESGEQWVEFRYDSARQRYFKQNHNGETTWYLGKVYERVEDADGNTQHKQFIYADGRLIALNVDVTKTDGEGNYASVDRQIRYSHSDALHSIDLITDMWGNVVERKNYDAWGKERPFEWSKPTQYVAQALMQNRGYTGHEHIGEVGLIHMNARVYDPTLARFLSADTYIQASDNSQSYNRYSYVLNNPMKYYDPSGHFWKKIRKAISRGLKKVTREVFKGVAKVKYLNTVLQTAACVIGGPAGCAGYAAASTLGYTGSYSDAFRAGAFSYAGARIYGVGNPLSSVKGTISFVTSATLSREKSTVVNFALYGLGGSFGQVAANAVIEAKNYYWKTRVEHYANKLGLSLYEANVLLQLNSELGLAIAGDTVHIDDKGVQIYGFTTRDKHGMWGVIWDVNDTILGYQGEIDAVGRSFIRQAEGQRISIGHSLGALRSTNLVRRGFASSAHVYALPATNIGGPGVMVTNGMHDGVSGGFLGGIFNPGSLISSPYSKFGFYPPIIRLDKNHPYCSAYGKC
ncbi:RHS repeat-associated core domain-containing protein [Vibrio mangrovi]|nr:RHS repeat-associated core domain-containing protein [Vibrio mangrovi]MDW6002466.1 RHS repeat-associated core domain-containing protein [Vibrio mangrovi]